MRAFADMTGGRAYVNTNDTRGAIREAVQDGSSYYMLSFARTRAIAGRAGERSMSRLATTTCARAMDISSPRQPSIR
jgi:hypothetical protein